MLIVPFSPEALLISAMVLALTYGFIYVLMSMGDDDKGD